MHDINLRRRNRVFKSLHKPLTYLGVERTVFYFVCVGAVGVFNLFESLLAVVVVFIGGFIFGRWVRTRTRRCSESSPRASASGHVTTPPSKKLHWSRCDKCSA